MHYGLLSTLESLPLLQYISTGMNGDFRRMQKCSTVGFIFIFNLQVCFSSQKIHIGIILVEFPNMQMWQYEKNLLFKPQNVTLFHVIC